MVFIFADLLELNVGACNLYHNRETRSIRPSDGGARQILWGRAIGVQGPGEIDRQLQQTDCSLGGSPTMPEESHCAAASSAPLRGLPGATSRPRRLTGLTKSDVRPSDGPPAAAAPARPFFRRAGRFEAKETSAVDARDAAGEKAARRRSRAKGAAAPGPEVVSYSKRRN